MTIEERLDRLATVVESVASVHVRRIDRLRRVVGGHPNQIDARDERIENLIPASVSQRERINALIRRAESRQDQIDAHDAQLDELFALAQKQSAKNEDLDRRLELLVEAMRNLERRWQAYIKTLPRQ